MIKIDQNDKHFEFYNLKDNLVYLSKQIQVKHIFFKDKLT